LQWCKVSNLFISILGIIASIIGLAIMSDWQAITPDSCLNYSPFHNSELLADLHNISSTSPTCWKKTKQLASTIHVANGTMMLPFANGARLNCKLHASASSCYVCSKESHQDLYFEDTPGEVCYKPSMVNTETSFQKLGIVCNNSKPGCLSLCLHIHRENSTEEGTEIGNAEIEARAKHDTYPDSLWFFQDFIYKSARNKCESHTASKCHWIPDSLVTHKACRDCQPICRGLSHTMTFIQFVVGSTWFMLTYPVAEIALPVVISDSTVKEYQVKTMKPLSKPI
jgi:hypothetical protein